MNYKEDINIHNNLNPNPKPKEDINIYTIAYYIQYYMLIPLFLSRSYPIITFSFSFC